MAPPSTLYRFRMKVSASLSPLDIRVAMHPSETPIFMISRVLAYALNYEDGIEFGAGLSDPDAPAIRIIGAHGEIKKWIDIGNPSGRRLHKSSKASASVFVYTYKNVESLKQEAAKEKIYNAHKIQIFAIDSDFLESLSEILKRDNSWTIAFEGDEVEVTTEEDVFSCTLVKHRL